MNDEVLSPEYSSASAGYFPIFRHRESMGSLHFRGGPDLATPTTSTRTPASLFLRHFGGDGELFEFDF